MSVFPGMIIRENFGLVDVHLIRRVYLPEEDLNPCELHLRDPSRVCQHGIEMVFDDIVADLNEVVRTRVRSLGGNCLIGYKINISEY